MINKIMHVHKEFQVFQKISVSLRNAKGKKTDNLNSFKEKLKTTMPFWPRNVFTLIKIDEDRKFLESMMNDRSATFGARDVKLKKVIEKRCQRKEEEEKQKDQERKRHCPVAEDVHILESHHNDIDNGDNDDNQSMTVSTESPTDYDQGDLSSRSHKRFKKVNQEIIIPHNIMKDHRITSITERLRGVTNAATTCIISTFIQACGGDPDQVTLSNSSNYRANSSNKSAISDRIMQNWVPSIVGTVHWDGKMMEDLKNKHVSVERLPVLFSGSNGVKLLGAPKLKASGVRIGNATYDLLETWPMY